ncbi:NlpC/P60 family protein [soil metagenome]
MRISALFQSFCLLLLVTIMVSCKTEKHISSGSDPLEMALKKKYAGLMGVKENEITNIALYKFIDNWYGAPYKSAGKSKAGVDCSGFVSILEAQVFNKTVSGSSTAIFQSCEVVSEKNLQEGDLVFFKINSDKVSHVGVYLKNRRFVHASTHKGVMINTLDEVYYAKYFFRGGRIK